jgi:hypothetical protein
VREKKMMFIFFSLSLSLWMTMMTARTEKYLRASFISRLPLKTPQKIPTYHGDPCLYWVSCDFRGKYVPPEEIGFYAPTCSQTSINTGDFQRYWC